MRNRWIRRASRRLLAGRRELERVRFMRRIKQQERAERHLSDKRHDTITFLWQRIADQDQYIRGLERTIWAWRCKAVTTVEPCGRGGHQ